MSTQRHTTLETNERLNKQMYIIPSPTLAVPHKAISLATFGNGGHQHEIYAALTTAGNAVEQDLGAQAGQIMNKWIGEVTESSFVKPAISQEWTASGMYIRCIIGDPVRDGNKHDGPFYIIPITFDVQ